MEAVQNATLELATGNPESALVYFLLFTAIGLVLGGVIFSLMAFQCSRRAQFRSFGTMPRFGAAVGILVAVTLIGMAWNSVYRDFYHLSIEGDTVTLRHKMPPRTVTIATGDVIGMRRTVELGKFTRRRIQLETAEGNYQSGSLSRGEVDSYWEDLSPYFTPLN